MVAAGLMSEAEAYADERAHAITGWLGADAYELEPHTAVVQAGPARGGRGLHGRPVELRGGGRGDGPGRCRRTPPDRPLHSAQVLVGHALDGGGHDNVTVAVLPFAVPPQGAGSA